MDIVSLFMVSEHFEILAETIKVTQQLKGYRACVSGKNVQKRDRLGKQVLQSKRMHMTSFEVIEKPIWDPVRNRNGAKDVEVMFVHEIEKTRIFERWEPIT
jgi:hypothetical protein